MVASWGTCLAKCLGSPPREWGQLLGRAKKPPPPVHPHASGDSPVQIRTEVGPGMGSPPREWGQPLRSPNEVTAAGRSGSPPREWGQLDGAPRVIYPAGFTPTRVGTAGPDLAPATELDSVHPHASGDSMRQGFPKGWSRRVHPHASGDSRGRLRSTRRIRGVHPHASGDSAHRIAWRNVPSRFTPTRVGTARYMTEQHRSIEEVHPHASGDSTRATISRSGDSVRISDGSPPREWGQLNLVQGTGCRNRVHPHASGDSPRMAIVSIQHCDYQRSIRRLSA